MSRKKHREEQNVGMLKVAESKGLNLRQSSQLARDLSCRIQTNQAFGNADLKTWILDKLELKKGERLLDVGCGTGAYLVEFAKRIGTEEACTGVDISSESLKIARETSHHLGLRINFILKGMDELNSNADSNRYDIITSMYALYYSKNPLLTLKNLAHMLNPDGRLAVLGPYMDNNKDWFDFLKTFMELPENVFKSSSGFMYEEVLPFAWAHFDVTACFRFVNQISIPSLEHLKQYWESNTYYEPKHDLAFMRYATDHFNKNSSFTFSKTALLILMSQRRSVLNKSVEPL